MFSANVESEVCTSELSSPLATLRQSCSVPFSLKIHTVPLTAWLNKTSAQESWGHWIRGMKVMSNIDTLKPQGHHQLGTCRGCFQGPHLNCFCNSKRKSNILSASLKAPITSRIFAGSLFSHVSWKAGGPNFPIDSYTTRICLFIFSCRPPNKFLGETHYFASSRRINTVFGKFQCSSLKYRRFHSNNIMY